MVPHVEAAGYRTLTYDLLGYGASERPVDRDTSVTAQAELLVELLDELDLARVNLVAHDIPNRHANHVTCAHHGSHGRGV